MATGASNADLAILLVDARKGLLTQTRRHAIIASLLGIRHVVLAVNKIDLVDYDEATFRRIVDAFDAFAEPLDFRSLVAIPISARFGDNVSVVEPAHALARRAVCSSTYLERVEVEDERRSAPFRLPVQWVNRPAPRFPRLRRHDRRRPGPARRRDRRRFVGPHQRGDRHPARRRGGRGRPKPATR